MRESSVLSIAMATWLVLILVAATQPPVDQRRVSALPDTTVVDSVMAGQVLIRGLPKALSGDSVLTYKGLRVPAQGWLRDRSFFWRTPGDAEGNYRFAFEARLMSGAVEAVYVRVFVGSSEL